ncbi:fas-binding factor 1 homolog [Columba livia]|uniref:fas-binding factor 1 homolog n=1 Tax=Columba livia TaxID=8932 RepID=UPI0031B9FBD7
MPVKRGTERSSETTAEQSSRKELPPRQTPLRTVAPVQRRKTSMFEDAEGDDLLDVLRRGKGPKKEEELRPARSTLDDLFGRGSAAKVLEKPEEEERGDKKELVFGEYKPSMGSRPAVQPAMGQLVRFSANSSSETNPEPRSTPRPPRRRNPVRRRRAGDDWLGWEDEDFMDPASQLGAAEEAAPKPDPMDWLIDALARRRAEEQAKAQETKAEPTETQEKKAKRSETEEKKAEPSEAQEKKNEPSEAQDTTAEPSRPRAARAVTPETRRGGCSQLVSGWLHVQPEMDIVLGSEGLPSAQPVPGWETLALLDSGFVVSPFCAGDKELEKQRIFLENLKKVRYNTAQLSTTPPSSSPSVGDTIEYTHALIGALRKASPPVQVVDLSSILRPPITFKTL